MSREELYYELRLSATDVPRVGFGTITVSSPAGEKIPMLIDGQHAVRLKVEFGRGGLRLKISPNGRVVIEDGKGTLQVMRISNWPVVKGTDHGVLLETKTIRDQPPPIPEETYPWGRQHG